MPIIYQQLIDQAVVDGVITPEQYLQIPWDERDTMQCLLSPAGRQAMNEGVITFEQYLQISSHERWIMQCLLSPDGRQMVAGGIVTLKQYLQVPLHERQTLQCGHFSHNTRQAIDDGVITLERYLQLSWDERMSLQWLFFPEGRQAIDNGVITLEQYLQIPLDEGHSMGCLFSPDGQQAIADGVITLEQYLQFSTHERDHMKSLFSPDGRQAIADGIITLEQYIQIPWDKRYSMQYLFSLNGRQAIADGTITLEQYLQIPSQERQNVMTALQDPETRQRIINGQITIENIIDLDLVHLARVVGVATPHFNGAQSTHTASVHQSVSNSASRLANCYQLRIDGAGLESTIKKAQAYISSLPDDSEKNIAAKRGFLRIVAPNYTFTDPLSQITTKQLLALTFLAIHDDEKRIGSLENAEMQFVEALYEIQRGYNLSKSGVDEGGQDQYICSAGTFNKFIEKLQGIYPDCQVLYITGATASLKLPIIVREEAMRYLETLANFNTAEALAIFTRLIAQVKKDGVEVIWDHIKDNTVTRMFDEFGSLYRDITDPDFTALVEAGKDMELDDLNDLELDDLNTFQEQVQSSSYLSKHGYDGSKDQKKELINPETLIYAQIDLQLNELESKSKSLGDRDHILAYCKAANIVRLLRELNCDYFIEKKIDYKAYEEKSLDIINQERSELDKHHGCKQILGDVLILIATLGTGQLVNKTGTGNFLLVNKVCAGNFLFFKTELLESTIKSLCKEIMKDFGLCK